MCKYGLIGDINVEHVKLVHPFSIPNSLNGHDHFLVVGAAYVMPPVHHYTTGPLPSRGPTSTVIPKCSEDILCRWRSMFTAKH